MIWVDFIRSTRQTKVGYFKTLVRHNAPHTVDQIKSTHSFVLRAIAIESHAQSPVKTVTHLIFINAAIMPMSDRLTILSVVYAEYAYTLQVDEKSDIYSFGVVLLEILTGRRSVDSEFGDAINIVDWVRSKIQTKEGIAEVLDQNVGASCGSVQEEMMLVLRVALLCTTRCPADRPSMRDVVSMLSEAKPRRKTLLNLHCLQQQQQQLLRSDPPSQATSPTASKTMA